MRVVYIALAVLALAHAAQAANWAVIVAGSAGYDNYRHQADACHAYHVAVNFGIPKENIIVMMQDDVANSPSNPFPGKLFNKPSPSGKMGVDVNAGCHKDYTGSQVTAANFLAVITGDEKTAGGKVLKSTATDRVFINFVDHGGVGLIAFPNGPYLYAQDLINALTLMHTKKMFGKLVFYMEACESGSMFEGLLPANLNIYATTAANGQESSWGTYCPPDDYVNGVELQSCLGDLYSVNWMENADSVGPSETLGDQYTIVKNLTAQSHVLQFGDLSFLDSPIGDFLYSPKVRVVTEQDEQPTPQSSTKVSSRDIPLHNAYWRYMRAEKLSEDSSVALENLLDMLKSRQQADALFKKLAMHLSVNGIKDVDTLLTAPVSAVGTDKCAKSAVQALETFCGHKYDDYSLQFHRVVVNACQSTHSSANLQLIASIKAICQA